MSVPNTASDVYHHNQNLALFNSMNELAIHDENSHRMTLKIFHEILSDPENNTLEYLAEFEIPISDLMWYFDEESGDLYYCDEFEDWFESASGFYEMEKELDFNVRGRQVRWTDHELSQSEQQKSWYLEKGRAWIDKMERIVSQKTVTEYSLRIPITDTYIKS